MADLRQHFERMGFSNVTTFIASGNVIFDARARSTPKLEATIERGLLAELGYDVSTFIRTLPDLDRVARCRPFAEAVLGRKGSSLYVIFVSELVSGRTRRKLQALRTDKDNFHANGREIYWYCRGTLSESLVNSGQLAKTVGVPMTMRNLTSVRKLVARYRDA